MLQNKPSRIVMFSAEATPFAKVGGMGDVVGALPKALSKLGFQTAVVIPAYASVLQEDRFDIRPCEAVSGITVRLGKATERAIIYQARLDKSDVDVYLVGSRKYFSRPGIYGDPDTGEGYSDNWKRFLFFMKAGIELLLRLKIPVDVIHCHDSHTALIPGIIRTNYSRSPFYSNVGTLFTIHNLAYQGVYPKKVLHYAGIDNEHFYPMSPFEYWNKVNFMKAGILLSDKVNTVSQTYAVEIRTSHEFGHGLEGVLDGRRMDVSGIVNGIDYEEWNPQSDPFIPARFSAGDLSGKETCKEHLRRHFGLPRLRGRVPVIGIVSRLADQKGFDLVADAVPEIVALNMQMVILGVGQLKYHKLLLEIAAKHPDKIGVNLTFDNELAHEIEAGCDMFLMPSKYEPCGLSQLISLRYGTIPVVRATGGLADTVVPYDRENGTGFLFREYSPEEMMAALEQAISVYSDPDRWRALMVRAMEQDWSWDKSAEKYRQLYRSIYNKRHS
ncbi:MAG: glycogen synthase GlgA [Acidobacteria bacterium]|nr:glycogen synthase GlgA [Acidobacteriota bacterium]